MYAVRKGVSTLFVVNVEAAIYKDDRWLVIRRSLKESHAAGMVSLVGGKVEHEGNQSDILERTLRREIVEEVGIEVSDGRLFDNGTSGRVASKWDIRTSIYLNE
jgi:8-oxo-dGTP diphosphatase